MDATIKATHPLPSVRMGEMIKKYDGSFVNKLTPEYIRRNYTEVKQEMDKINCIVKNIEIGEIEPQLIQKVHGISQWTRLPYNFVEFANECRVLYNNALMAHGLKVNEDNGELVAATQEDRAVIQSQYGSSLYRLKKMFSKNKDKRNIEDDLLKYQDFYTKTEDEMERLHNNGEDTTQIESLLFKAKDEINIIKAIRDNYDNPENLTEEQRQYANMYYAIKDEAYKEDKKTKIHLLREIEDDMKDGITDVENVKAEINALANRLYSDMSVEELEEHRTELYIVSTSILKDGITTYADTWIGKLKVFKIISLANKLRAADILAGIRSDSITLDDLTQQERNSIINSTEGEITELDIAEYAKKMGVLAEKPYENVMEEFYKDETVYNELNRIDQASKKTKETGFESKHKNMSEKIQEVLTEGKKANDDELKYDVLKAEYDLLKNKLIELKSKDADAYTKDIQDIEMSMWLLQIKYRLVMEKNYKIYGGTETALSGAFRSMNMFEYGPERMMSEEEFKVLFEKLVSGTFEENTTEEQQKQYTNDNKEALGILKRNAIARCKTLYQKYGFKFPDMEYIYENYLEMSNEFKLTQNDEQLIATDGAINMEDEKEKLLYNLVKFYSGFAFLLKNGFKGIFAGVTYATDKQEHRNLWDAMTAEHYTYLKEHEGDILKL